MLNYEISLILHNTGPIIAGTLAGAICVIIGILISNMFWKARIHRYAKTEIVQVMEYQKNKIEQLESIIREKDSIISDQRGSLKVAKIAALKIVGCIE